MKMPCDLDLGLLHPERGGNDNYPWSMFHVRVIRGSSQNCIQANIRRQFTLRHIKVSVSKRLELSIRSVTKSVPVEFLFSFFPKGIFSLSEGNGGNIQGGGRSEVCDQDLAVFLVCLFTV